MHCLTRRKAPQRVLSTSKYWNMSFLVKLLAQVTEGATHKECSGKRTIADEEPSLLKEYSTTTSCLPHIVALPLIQRTNYVIACGDYYLRRILSHEYSFINPCVSNLSRGNALRLPTRFKQMGEMTRTGPRTYDCNLQKQPESSTWSRLSQLFLLNLQDFLLLLLFT